MGELIKIGKASDIADGTAKCFDCKGKTIAVFNLGGEYFAIDDACSHVDGPLSEGFIEGEEVECPWHGARFNIKTGAALCDPAEGDLAKYPVRVSGDDLEIEV